MFILDNIFTVFMYLFPVLFIFLGVVIFMQIMQRRGRLIKSLNMSLLLVTMPKDSQKDEKTENIKELIGQIEQLYSILGSIGAKDSSRGFFSGPSYLGLEIASIGKEINFYIAAPKHWQESVIKHIQGIYPSSEVQKIEDYNIFNPRGCEAAARLFLRKDYLFPIKTYKRLESDSIGEISNVFSKIREGEGGAVQIIFKKENSRWRHLAQGIAREMQKGKSYNEAKDVAGKGAFRKIAGEMFESMKSGGDAQKNKLSEESKPVTPMQQEIIKMIEEKASKMGFGVNVRLVSSAATQERADELLSQLRDAFSQFDDPNLNGFNFSKGNKKSIVYDFSFRNYDSKNRVILNTEELASIFHFPIFGLGTPKIKWLKARSASAPVDLSQEGIIIGKNVFRGEETEVRIANDDRRRHLYLLGQTGTGKSALMQEMVRRDIEAGKGVCVIDPHGDLIEKILGNVPKERIEDVILFNPSDLDLPIGLNMFEYDQSRPEQKTFIINELINIVQKLFAALPEAFGPMYEQYTRNTMRLLLDNADIGPFTLMEMPKIFINSEFRHYLLSRETNITVKEFWQSAEAAKGEQSLENFATYITSKFDNFINNEYVRLIIGQSRSGLNFRDIMDQGKILLVNLTKGRLGDINSSLIGMIIVGKILLASFSRVDMPEEQRKDFYLYIDEFQNFTTESISSILAEARKYRLNLIVAHQFIGQLQEKIRDAIFGNVGSMAIFRIGAEDAEFMAKQFKTVFSETDLLNIDNFNAYVKILVNGKISRPFNIETYSPEKGVPEIVSLVKEFSRKMHGRPKEQVEKEILERSQVAESAEEEEAI